MKEKTSNKEKIALFVAFLFVVGGGCGAVILFIKFIDIYYPELNRCHRPSIMEAIVAFVLMMGILCIGMLIGYVLLMFVLRPFFTKKELSESVTNPSLPIYTDVLLKLIDALYPKN